MARASTRLVTKLRQAASEIETSQAYSWGHITRCNCGFLAQCLVPFDKKQLYQAARQNNVDEWSEFAEEYCPQSGRPIDDLIDALIHAGLELTDISQLEYLSNHEVLHALPGGFRYLQKGNASDAALYMRTWAGLLELELKASAKTAVEKRTPPAVLA